MARIAFLIILNLILQNLQAQKALTWDELSDVEFTSEYVEEFDVAIFFPHFGSKVKELEGQEVFITGYILVIDAKKGIYILSKNPYASCFFCGNAGPESIIELQLKSPHPKFKMDQVVNMRGILRLNEDDIYHCNYILSDAEVMPR
jgi:hypothetical protein